MMSTVVYKKPGRIAANFELRIHITVYTPQKSISYSILFGNWNLSDATLFITTIIFVNWQVVIVGLDQMGWYVDKVLCLGDLSKETLNSYTGYLIYHSISTLQVWVTRDQSHQCWHAYFNSVINLLVKTHVTIPWWPSIECSPIGQKCPKMI